MNRKGMLVIISGPSGSGKGTVVKGLDPELGYAVSTSMTTRKIRPGEVDGKDYFFVSEEEFTELRDSNGLLEHAVFVGNFYGTPLSYVEEQISKGKAVVLEIEVEGALQVKDKFNDAVLIFLMPPTIEELSSRLFNRATEDKMTIEQRLFRAKNEIKYINQYDYLVINDEVEKAVKKINTIVSAEYLKPHRNKHLVENFKGDEFDVASFIFGVDDTFK
ncbi:MAG: guanylate kinase [Clostridiales bacterium]|jgi:guanylate kinase|nr:guanylate kinase [Clostridiales bacterium]